MVAGHSDLLNLLSMGTTVNGLWQCFQMNHIGDRRRKTKCFQPEETPPSWGVSGQGSLRNTPDGLGLKGVKVGGQLLDLQKFWGMLHLQKLTMGLGVKYFSHWTWCFEASKYYAELRAREDYMARRQACHLLGSTGSADGFEWLTCATWGMSQTCAPVEIGWSRVTTCVFFGYRHGWQWDK